MFFFWIVAFIVEGVFDRQLGEAGGFVIIMLGIVGVWAGYETRKNCRARAAKA